MKPVVIIFSTAIIASLAIVGVAISRQMGDSSQVDFVTNVSTATPISTTSSTSTARPTNIPSTSTLPDQVTLTMQFTSQAPFGVWDALHEDACEEASLLMVRRFLDGKSMADKTAVDAEITDLVHTGESMGQGLSITMDQLNALAKRYYGLNGTVKSVTSLNDIKQELANGKLVILPLAGKLLNNPNFTAGGPMYHALVVKGYDSEGFITNDPGTRKGENYHYTYATIDNALHDWDAGNIENGQRVYLVF